jgi:hypothetical protein
MNNYGLWCILYTSFGAFFYGYDSGLTTSIIAYPEFISYFNFNSTTLGALGSVYYAGKLFGLHFRQRFALIHSQAISSEPPSMHICQIDSVDCEPYNLLRSFR